MIRRSPAWLLAASATLAILLGMLAAAIAAQGFIEELQATLRVAALPGQHAHAPGPPGRQGQQAVDILVDAFGGGGAVEALIDLGQVETRLDPA